MANFDGTCAITGVAIKRGEPVMAVYLDEDMDGQKLPCAYDLIQQVMSAERALQVISNSGIQVDPGDLLTWIRINERVHVLFGLYDDDTGWLEGEACPRNWDRYRRFMVKLEVGQKIAYGFDKNMYDQEEVYKSVLSMAYLCRITLWRDGPTGSRFFDQTEQQMHEFSAVLTLEAMAGLLRSTGQAVPEYLEQAVSINDNVDQDPF